MNRLTFRTENQWPYVRDGGCLSLLNVTVNYSPFALSFMVELLGFGVGLIYWRAATRAWEPIETDGWSGLPQGELNRGYLDEPQGKEHAP